MQMSVHASTGKWMWIMAERYYHPDYRKAEVSQIVGALDQGLSVSVIGAPSVGKSNLLKFLDQERLLATDPASPWVRYAPNTTHRGTIVAVTLDPNALLPPLPDERGGVAAGAWPGFELLIHRTATTPQLYPTYQSSLNQTTDSDLIRQVARLQEQFENAHPEVADFADSLHGHLALRHLESILEATLECHRIQGTPIRIAYVIDEFDRMLDTLPDYFFVALRSVRDRFKYQVMFVTFTRNSLPYLIGEGERMLALEPFVELFHDSTVYLGPFGDDDVWRVIEQLEDRTVSKEDRGLGLLIRASGSIAGLLRAGFKHADKLSQVQGQDYPSAVELAASRLVAESNVQAECKTLLRGLNEDEIKTLYGVSEQRANLNQDTVRELLNKSLLTQATAGGVIRVSPPVLAAYIRNHPTPPPAPPPTRPVTMPR
jgi:hypothetical protein